jgi:hypothetical protein
VATLEKLGVAIEGRIPCIVKANLFNQGYLEAKAGRMKHFLDGATRTTREVYDTVGRVGTHSRVLSDCDWLHGMGRAGCHPLVLLSIRPTRVVMTLPGVSDWLRGPYYCFFYCKITW